MFLQELEKFIFFACSVLDSTVIITTIPIGWCTFGKFFIYVVYITWGVSRNFYQKKKNRIDLQQVGEIFRICVSLVLFHSALIVIVEIREIHM